MSKLSSLLVRGRLAWLLLVSMTVVACERPDPLAGVTATPTPMPPTMTAAPTETATPEATATPPQPQVFVFVLPQAAGATAEAPSPTPTEAVILPTPIPPVAFPEDHLLGWAWTSSLRLNRSLLEVDPEGVVLLDRPDVEGEAIGLVLGLADVLVAGQSRCGFTPILVHEDEMLSINMPIPAVVLPQPLDASDGSALAVERPDTTSGWAFTDELTITGQTAIAGSFGISLRAEPCRYAQNLGFVPANVEMFVIGPPTGDYTPVRVDDRFLQPPINMTPPSLGRLPTRLPNTVTTPPASSP
ncbi:MAG: hypothetical protein R3300_14215 [Candidatus Promineifilaceae bacterium]|nr:hypothetical protein [Candidatus Promineifilaceae bacterium]